MLAAATTTHAAPGVLNAGFLLGLMLFAAIVGGFAARSLRIPRVVGFLLAGLGLRYALLAIIGPEKGEAMLASAAGPLGAVKTLALGLIMFTLGGVCDTAHLRSVGPRVLKIGIMETLFVVLLVGGGCCAVWMMRHEADLGATLAAGILLGVVGLATAPAATLLVLREYEAKGPMSDTILAATAFNNIISIVLFHTFFLIFSSTGIIHSAAGEGRILWLDLLLTSAGSAALGVLLGFLFGVFYAKFSLPEFLLFFFAVLLGLGAGADFLTRHLHLSFNFLLTALFFGATFANVTMDPGPLQGALRSMSSPLYAAFFVLAGFGLHVGELGKIGLLGVVYVVLRVLGKYLGARLGLRWSKPTTDVQPYLGLGMLCQAGVAIGLADFLYNTWLAEPGSNAPHQLASHFKTIVLGSVAAFEIIGPVVLKEAAKRSGEVKALTLIRRQRASTAEGDSITKLTLRALLRMFGLGGRGGRRAMTDQLVVSHIMRSNIKFLRADDKMDEVLHFVETSRFNHFPVLDAEGQFVGMINFADLRDIIYDPTVCELVTAWDLADPATPRVPAHLPLDELLERFRQDDVEVMVVTDNPEEGPQRVLGLVEQRDLLRALHATV